MLSLVCHQHYNGPPPMLLQPLPLPTLYPLVRPCHAPSSDLDDDGLFDTLDSLEALLYVSSDESDLESDHLNIAELKDTPCNKSSLFQKLHQAQVQLMESGGFVHQGAILGVKGEYLAKKGKPSCTTVWHQRHDEEATISFINTAEAQTGSLNGKSILITHFFESKQQPVSSL